MTRIANRGAPRPSAADLSAMFGMTPENAIAYLQKKGFEITWDWHEMDAAAHARAFTVAKATSLDVLRDLRDGMRGRSLREYQRDLEPVLRAKGWWGKKEILDADTGEVTRAQLGSPRRLATIYQTNMQSAYMAGRYVDAIEAVDTHPYAMYIAVMDACTRPSHAALHGRVFRLGDPVWQHICPPNGYNCRCRFVTLTEAAVRRRGLVVESSAGRLGTVQVATHRDPQTGQTQLRDVTTLRLPSRDGRAAAFRPDAGFDGGPMASHLMDDALYRKASAALAPRQALAEVQSALLSEARMTAWCSFVQRVLAPRGTAAPASQGQTFGIGVMRPQELAHARQAGLEPSGGIIHVADRGMAASALTPAQWGMLPKRLAKPRQVLWDTRRREFVYVLAGTGSADRVAVRVARFQTGAVSADDGAVVESIDARAIQDGLASGRYQKIR